MSLRTAVRVLRLRIMLPLLFQRGSLPELMEQLDRSSRGRATSGLAGGERSDRAGTSGIHAPGPASAEPASPTRDHAGEVLVPLVAHLTRPLRFWRTTCLWRSLAGYSALRAAGDDVRFLIGVRTDRHGEVEAHAWLERAGRPSLLAPRPEEGYRVAFAWPADPANLPRRTEANVDAIRPSDEAVLTELKDGTGVLLHLGSKHYYTLNATGVLCWKLLSAGEATTAAALAAAVSARHPEADQAAVRADVGALLAELAAEKLVALPP
jgi:hypothetical protein